MHWLKHVNDHPKSIWLNLNKILKYEKIIIIIWTSDQKKSEEN